MITYILKEIIKNKAEQRRKAYLHKACACPAKKPFS